MRTINIRRLAAAGASLGLLASITACGSSDSASTTGASDVSWKDVTSKKVDATTACKNLLGAQNADSAKKLGETALASAPDDVTITGELDGDSGGKSGHGDANLQCNINGTATRFYPGDEADDMTTEDSVSASEGGFGAEAHSGSKGPGMQAVLASAVSHLKP